MKALRCCSGRIQRGGDCRQQARQERGLLYFGTLTYSNDTTGRMGTATCSARCNNAWMSARVLGQYLNENMPGKTYFYITSDYTWGHTSESSLRQATGTVDTSKHQGVRTAPRRTPVRLPRRAREAANSGAEVLVLVLFGEDMVRAMRIADELGLNKKMQIAVPNLTLSMVELAGGHHARRARHRALDLASARAGRLRARQGVRAQLRRALPDAPSSSAASAYSIVYQWADAVSRAKTIASEPVIAALENHSYSLLKGQQQWRAFDHQNVQTVYAVRVKPVRKYSGSLQAGLLRDRPSPVRRAGGACAGRMAGRAPRGRPAS